MRGSFVPVDGSAGIGRSRIQLGLTDRTDNGLSPVRFELIEATAMVILRKLLTGKGFPRLIVGLLVGYFIYQGTVEYPQESMNLLKPAYAVQTPPSPQSTTKSPKSDFTERISFLAKRSFP